jgi:hypothetical protein
MTAIEALANSAETTYVSGASERKLNVPSAAVFVDADCEGEVTVIVTPARARFRRRIDHPAPQASGRSGRCDRRSDETASSETNNVKATAMLRMRAANGLSKRGKAGERNARPGGLLPSSLPRLSSPAIDRGTNATSGPSPFAARVRKVNPLLR